MPDDKTKNFPPVPHRHEGKLNRIDSVLRAIDSYFEQCDKRGMSYTLAGLAYYLGVADPNLLRGNWNSSLRSVDTAETVRLFSRPAVQEALRLAKLRIEAQRASQLLDTDGNVQALIFDLKATFGWVDKQNLQIENPDGNLGSKAVVVMPALPGQLTMDQWQKFYDSMKESREERQKMFLEEG